MSLVDSSIDCGVHTRIKRKLDDFDLDDDFQSDLVSVRMRKDEPNAAAAAAPPAVNSTSTNLLMPPQHPQFQHSSSSQFLPRDTSSSSAQSVNSPPTFSSRLQFFVRLISEGNTLVLNGNPEDTVKSIHEKIYAITGIPVIEQRLIYRGKQLQWERSLAESSFENDCGLQLVGRMRSTEHPQAWQLIDDIVSLICRLCKNESRDQSKWVKARLTEFLYLIPKHDSEQADGHLKIFMSSCVPAALVMLHISPYKNNKECGAEAIRLFTTYIRTLPKPIFGLCAPIVLEFCKLLKSFVHDDDLYNTCRSCLASMGEYIMIEGGASKSGDITICGKVGVTVRDIFELLTEIATRLLSSLMESITSEGPSFNDVRDFTAFLQIIMSVIKDRVTSAVPIKLPYCEDHYNASCYAGEIKFLHNIFLGLLEEMEKCLDKMEGDLAAKVIKEVGWDQYLTILKELNSVSKLYQGAEEYFWSKLRSKKVSMCYLIMTYAKRADDHKWILKNKDVTNFESRRHLAMMLLPEVKDDYEELHEMLIDRSQLLAESFEYIARAETDTLRSGLFMEFKNEEATGPGVLREWFFLVCQEIFNPQSALFVACPNDRRRFFPNPASKVDPLHLEYFSFSGRVIALALMHKVQVGIVFDRVFFLQLAGMKVSLEDIRDADPYLYSSCKKILDMDPDIVDQDALSLTFVREVEELGSRKVVELCADGKNIVVNSKNRTEYVDLLIQHRFVTSIAEQVSHFTKGFADIIDCPRIQKLFFQSLELEDLDWMLHGSESAINVEDWKSHTEYNGYKEIDPQISWFWKIVGEMTAEQRKVLLFFWTSVKYLPIEGFRGLASRLYIFKSTESIDRLPSSHTCFYRLCFPPYPSMSIMQDRLNVITQEHVGCSFGTW